MATIALEWVARSFWVKRMKILILGGDGFGADGHVSLPAWTLY